MANRTIKIITFLLLLGISFSNIQAQNQADIDARISYIEKHFKSERETEKTWFWGWFAFMSTVFVSSATLYAVLPEDNENRDPNLINMSVSTLALSNLVLFRPTSMYAGSELAEMPADTAEEKQRKLARAEKLLDQAAFRQRYGTGWVTHTLTFLVNLTAAGVEWLYLDRPGFAAARFVLGTAVGEYKIYTQSRGSIKAYNEYKGNYLGANSVPTYDVSFAYWGRGAAVTLRF